MLEYLYLIIPLIILGLIDKALDEKISDWVIGFIAFVFFTIIDFFKLLKHLICVPMYLIKYGMTENYYVNKITSGYDCMFFKSKNMKAVTRRMKKLKKLTWNFKIKKEVKIQKETIKFLNKAKWVL